MPDHNTEDYYRARAPEYEQIYYREVPERRREIDEEAERLRALVKNRTVLELACGTGYWTRVMSETAAAVTASDISAEMIAEARKKMYTCPVEFAVADMLTQDFGVKDFDVVALGFWYSHQPRQHYDRLYECLTRPLKSGGRIWMIDNNPPAEGSLHHSEGSDEYGNNYKRRFLDDGREYVIVKNYFTRPELEALLRPKFDIYSLVHQVYYWSVVLGQKSP
jgi:ubiquinone/menaquinone biosynthesis C-methylase UbiE